MQNLNRANPKFLLEQKSSMSSRTSHMIRIAALLASISVAWRCWVNILIRPGHKTGEREGGHQPNGGSPYWERPAHTRFSLGLGQTRAS
jgi:hypothetical protein